MPGENRDQASLPTVLFVATPAALGGSNRSLITVLSHLEGKVNRVLAAPAVGTFRELVDELGVADEFVPLPRRPQHPIDRILRLGAGIKIAWWALRNRRRLAAIHANALTGLNLSALAALMVPSRVVVWIHDPVGSAWGRVLGPVLRRVVRRLQIAAVSTVAESVAVENGLCDQGSAAIVPNPVDPDEILAPAGRSGIEPLNVGFVGGATERKGFDLLPAMIRRTEDLPIVWKLYVFLERMPDNRHVWDELEAFDPDRVMPVGKLADVAAVYGDLDIVFIPSRAESFCRVAAEAMLNGLPVLGTDIPPLLSLLGNDEAGLIFPTDDLDSAEAGLRRLVADAALREELGAEGRLRAAQFTPERITMMLTDLYGV